MQTILLTVNASPYGSERLLSALRLTLALLSHPDAARVRLFLLSDAVSTAMSQQLVATPPNLGEMLSEAMALGAEVHICRSCADARGLQAERLLPGVQVGTMPELAEWTLAADKVLSF